MTPDAHPTEVGKSWSRTRSGVARTSTVTLRQADEETLWRRRQHWNFYTWLLVLGAAGYVVARIVWLFQPEIPHSVTDSPSYYLADWPRTSRPWVVSALFSVWGPTRTASLIATLVSAFSFIALAAVIACILPKWKLAALLIPLFSFSPLVMGWDALVLSESLGIAGMVWVLAAAGSLAVPWLSGTSRTVLLGLGICFGVGSKDTNMVLLLPVVAAFAHVAFRGAGDRRMRIGLGICASCLVILTATDLGASRNRLPVWLENEVPQKVQERVTASSVRSMNIFYEYVVPNPRMLERWQGAGAPYPPAATDIV